MAESMTYDVIVVGAGPAGLGFAIRYAQLCREANKEPRICVLEKGSEVGANIISGAAFDPKALNALIPDWAAKDSPINTPVTRDAFYWLTAQSAVRLPTPPQMHNKGNYIISLGLLCRWLAQQAESLGVEIYPGFAGSAFIFSDNNQVLGVKTGDVGIDKNGERTAGFQPGMEIYATHTVLAEGCRGSLARQAIDKFALTQHCQPQSYGLGIKEIWEVAPKLHRPGTVVHTVGWPLNNNTYGGSFIYHWGTNLVSIGLIVGLDYKNPYFDPYQEFQRFKHHPHIEPLLTDGQCISYGARAINEGGYQSIPQLTFPGGLLIGDAAGFLNVPQIKGSHTAMQSGMIAAESVFKNQAQDYPAQMKSSWVSKELYRARNIRPSFHWGLWAGLAYSAIDTYILRGHAPWTFTYKPDYSQLKPAADFVKPEYPKPDGKISFAKLTSVARTNVHHGENQPCHLKLKDPSKAISVNWDLYKGPEQYYCPAGVYEFIENADQTMRLQINASNCIHCKTCDIKDPTQNIVWVPPEGGGGPNYGQM